MTRPRRARAGISLIALVVGALWVVVPATPASAAATLTVTPSTALGIGETVAAVTGSGWAPNQTIAFCEAPVGAPPPVSVNDCRNGLADGELNTDSNGNFSSQVIITRLIRVPALNGFVDCADTATPCVIAAAVVVDLTGTLVTAPLSFVTPPLPTLQPLTTHQPEGNSANSTLSLDVLIQNPNVSTITTSWKTVFVPGAPGDQADPATDYTPASGTITFSPGTFDQTVTIVLNGDTLVEPDEYIAVQFDKPANAILGGQPDFDLGPGFGFGYITNDDHARIVPGVATASEGNAGASDLHVPVTLSNPSTQTVTAQWRTVPVPGAPGDQADPTTDYTPASGTVTFAPGETSKSVTISINGDTTVEPDEYFVVQFGNPTNASMGGFWGLGFGGITNDDGGG